MEMLFYHYFSLQEIAVVAEGMLGDHKWEGKIVHVILNSNRRSSIKQSVCSYVARAMKKVHLEDIFYFQIFRFYLSTAYHDTGMNLSLQSDE